MAGEYISRRYWTLPFPWAPSEMFIDNSGVQWDVVEVDGGPEAFLTRPQLVADAIVKAVEGWSTE